MKTKQRITSTGWTHDNKLREQGVAVHANETFQNLRGAEMHVFDTGLTKLLKIVLG